MAYTVHGILHTRILEWVAFPFSRGSSQPKNRTRVSCTAGGFFYRELIKQTRPSSKHFTYLIVLIILRRKYSYYSLFTEIKDGGSEKSTFLRFSSVAQSCPTLCDPMDYTVHGILQARILEWVTFPFSRGSSQPKNRTQVSCIAGWFFSSWATSEAQD